MISEFSVKPKASNNTAKLLVLFFSIGAVTLFGISFAMQNYKGLVALGAMFFAVGAIMLATKYLFPEFYYDVVRAEDEWLFVVRQCTGKRYTTLCRVGLASVTSVEKVTTSEKQKPVLRDFRRYSYMPTCMPKSYYVMTVVSRYEKAKLSLELTDDMAALLLSYAREARELATDEEE